MCEEGSPASGTRVAGGDHGDRQRPVDRKIWVVVRDAQVLGGVVRTIDPIAHVGGGGQRLEAVQEARRNVEMSKVVVVEQKRLLFAERRESFRMSTSTSCTAPLAHRTSFASPRPERPCMPRITPFAERDWESCMNDAEIPGATR